MPTENDASDMRMRWSVRIMCAALCINFEIISNKCFILLAFNFARFIHCSFFRFSFASIFGFATWWVFFLLLFFRVCMVAVMLRWSFAAMVYGVNIRNDFEKIWNKRHSLWRKRIVCVDFVNDFFFLFAVVVGDRSAGQWCCCCGDARSLWPLQLSVTATIISPSA